MSTVLNDARKIAYLAHLYPGKKLSEIMDIMFIPGIARDTALWEAEEQKWVAVDLKKDTVTSLEIVELPDEDDWLSAIRERIEYLIEHQNAREEDVDEVILLDLLHGYSTHDVLVAINLLLDDGSISNYTVTEGKEKENVYTFYCLPEHEGSHWGLKRFPNKEGLEIAAKNELTL